MQPILPAQNTEPANPAGWRLREYWDILLPQHCHTGNRKAYIDNIQLGEKVWHLDDQISINAAIKAFNEWASDAPVLFELEAQKSLTNCLQSFMIKE